MGDMNKDGIRMIDEFKELYDSNNNSLIGLSIVPRALYTTSLDYLEECEKLATDYKLPIHIHLLKI